MIPIKVCTKCGVEKPISAFKPRKNRNNKPDTRCYECLLAYNREYRKRPGALEAHKQRKVANHKLDPRHILVESARRRSRILGIACTVTVEDLLIPELCPVLGIKLLVIGGHCNDSSPTLDRVDPNGGYTHDNVRVISFRANSIKRNATPDELYRVFKYASENSAA